ncbi:MAG: peptidoglycan DD-metalloendopeptidase family protein, partial [Caulobacteraceae bacterium]
GGAMQTFALSSHKQLVMAGAVAVLLVWTLISTTALIGGAIASNADEREAIRTKNYYERLIADRQARLNSAVAELSGAQGSVGALADSVTKRHAALTLLLTDLRGAAGAAKFIVPASLKSLQGHSASDQVRGVMADQERLVAEAETYAHSRADRLRLALRMAGLDPASFSGRGVSGEGLGGPLIESKDPRALAAILDVDEDFARRIQGAALDLNASRALEAATQRMPLAKPVSAPVRSSGFGVRFDPFTGRPAFHAGQDFSGGYLTPIFATAPGVVSYTGVRTGYGNVVEIDHGQGFKTRYAHLSGMAVSSGQHVGVGQRVGAMGSTGRSTGVHLHYEVWVNGRVQDPTRFLKAGDYVQQN